METGKISASQLGCMMYPVVIATGIVIIPSITAKYAGQDMWLSPILASLMGILVIVVAIKLHKLYPGQTIMEYSVSIIGKVPGKLLGFIYLYFYLLMNAGGTRIYADFVTGAFFSETPLFVILATIMLVSSFAVRGGIEVVGRSAEMVVPVYALVLTILCLLLIPDLNPKNILPIMPDGLMPSIKGAYTPQSWFAEFFVIAFLLPYVKDVQKAGKWGMISWIFVVMGFMATNLSLLFLFGGELTDRFNYPLLDAVRYISIAEFLQHLESLVMAIWVAGTFIKLAVVHYALVIGTAQWLNLSNYKPLVFPLGFLTVLVSIWGISSEMEAANYSGTIFPSFSIVMQTCIPLILLGIGILRKRNNSG
ncbi:GerAB/ArcD/ProY family transporter [Thalassobacillus devorans]|uniref:GerAB/ArcD/ProY family transporter n=1 Tax=Thalassobacillus devorans TaxID=279813 RepID=UPI00048D3948|nr:endospore germination permease [Thalassobacillus devorans]